MDIHRDHYKYLGFAFDFDGQTRYFFHSPAFRVSECLHLLFYKTPTPAKQWRSMGHSCLVYLDDYASTGKARVISLYTELTSLVRTGDSDRLCYSSRKCGNSS